MRKIAGVGIFCIVFGMFLGLLVRDRLASFLIMAVLGIAGYFCISDL